MNRVLNNLGQTISLGWASRPNEFLRCPYPECNHTGEIITKMHCRMVHGITRDELKEQYGMPIVVEGRGAILSDNNGRKWNNSGGTYLI